MKKIWLVWTGDYSDKDVLAVCSTEAKAAAVVKMLERQDADSPRFSVLLLDKLSTPAERGLLCYEVSFDVDGNAGAYMPSNIYGNVGEVIEYKRSGGIRIIVMARDEAHAIKVASEKRAAYLAHKQGLS